MELRNAGLSGKGQVIYKSQPKMYTQRNVFKTYSSGFSINQKFDAAVY